MDVCEMHSESEEGEILSDFEKDFTEELSNLPHVLKFICKLRNHVKKQRKKINKLQKKLIEQKHQNSLSAKTSVDCGTQTDPFNLDKSLLQDWDISNNIKSSTIVDQVKQVAESALLQSGFVYEETSGMYYDYNTGYYYDTRQRLYYDGNTGTYYYYDETSNTYQFHSQVCANEVTTARLSTSQKKEEKKTGKTYKDDVKKRKILSDDDNSEEKEPEEGECSESENDDVSDEVTPDISTSESDCEEEPDLAKSYPPCMRIIVKETNLPKLKVGSLFLVTYIGGSLGREGDHSVLIPDINVSKHHARFTYDKTKKQYQLIDSGSRNGTYLNGKRLSVAKQESEAHEITHGSAIKIGGTKLLCHIHNGNETCGHCEPGLVQQSVSVDENKVSKKKLHKDELRRLKHKFGFVKDNVCNNQLAAGYQDRAQVRRQNVGSSHHRDKTEQSSVHTSIAKDNKGFKLLSKMGWSEGHSLGKDGDGITEPVPIKGNFSKAGIGANSEADFPSIEIDSSLEKKQTMWRKTQERYKEIAD